MAPEDLEAGPRLGAPDPGCAVIGGGEDQRAVRGEDGGEHLAAVTPEALQALPGLGTPDPGRVVKGGREGLRSHGRQHRRAHRSTVAPKSPEAVPGLRAPEPRRVVVGTGGQQLAWQPDEGELRALRHPDVCQRGLASQLCLEVEEAQAIAGRSNLLEDGSLHLAATPCWLCPEGRHLIPSEGADRDTHGTEDAARAEMA
mmetsp:Transcript_102750/g.306996  ORF Transcript_102750/g.306996 Transcript_102750/m.306996 type:complete len:200 (-) Transcript_102750:9-608(-)